MIITEEGVFASTVQYLIRLVENPQYVQLLDLEDKSYVSLVEWILCRSSMTFEGVDKYPPLKNIGASIGISGQKVTKYIKAIYDDIIELNNTSKDLFVMPDEIVCCFSFKYSKRSGYFYIGIKSVPRIGDQFIFDFMLPLVGTDMFYIRDISHIIIKGVHEVDVTATGHEQFLYLSLLREKAYLKNYITWRELNGFVEEDRELNKRLTNQIAQL